MHRALEEPCAAEVLNRRYGPTDNPTARRLKNASNFPPEAKICFCQYRLAGENILCTLNKRSVLHQWGVRRGIMQSLQHRSLHILQERSAVYLLYTFKACEIAPEVFFKREQTQWMSFLWWPLFQVAFHPLLPVYFSTPLSKTCPPRLANDFTMEAGRRAGSYSRHFAGRQNLETSFVLGNVSHTSVIGLLLLATYTDQVRPLNYRRETGELYVMSRFNGFPLQPAVTRSI